jgi:hypothetical protein
MFSASPVEFLLIGAVITLTAFWFWTIVDCAVRNHRKDMDKLVWVFIIVSTYVFGSLAYLFVWRSRTTRSV